MRTDPWSHWLRASLGRAGPGGLLLLLFVLNGLATWTASRLLEGLLHGGFLLCVAWLWWRVARPAPPADLPAGLPPAKPLFSSYTRHRVEWQEAPEQVGLRNLQTGLWTPLEAGDLLFLLLVGADLPGEDAAAPPAPGWEEGAA